MNLTPPELLRQKYFRNNRMLENFIACALEDLQHSENDYAHEELRQPRDSGTVYSLKETTFDRMSALCNRFAEECEDHIAAALELEPGGEGLKYADEPMTYDYLGTTLWLALTGSGVGFEDDGDAPCLTAMQAWARGIYCEGLIFDDEGGIELIA